jgi:hypothetical protein
MIDIEWVREISGDPGAELLEASDYKVVLAIKSRSGGRLEEDVSARNIIKISDAYIVEDDDNPDDWLMGKYDQSSKKIICKGYYGELESVLEGLRATSTRS